MKTKTKKEILEFMSQNLPKLQLIYLFGSEASGETHSNSDIDLAFLCENNINNVTRFELQEALASKLNKDIDLVDLTLSSDVLKMQAIYGENLYTINQSFKIAFENRVMQDYIDLKEMLRPLYKSIKTDKSIYG